MGPVTIHQIDADDSITFVDDGFRIQAELAGSPSLPAEALGTSVFRYLAGEETRVWYHWLLERVRQAGQIDFRLRCDTAVLRRDVELIMRPLQQNGVEFECRPVFEAPRPFTPLLDPRVARSHHWVTMCSWCKRIQTVIGWLELEAAVRTLEVFENPLPPSIEYGLAMTMRTG